MQHKWSSERASAVSSLPGSVTSVLFGGESSGRVRNSGLVGCTREQTHVLCQVYQWPLSQTVALNCLRYLHHRQMHTDDMASGPNILLPPCIDGKSLFSRCVTSARVRVQNANEMICPRSTVAARRASVCVSRRDGTFKSKTEHTVQSL